MKLHAQTLVCAAAVPLFAFLPTVVWAQPAEPEAPAAQPASPTPASPTPPTPTSNVESTPGNVNPPSVAVPSVPEEEPEDDAEVTAEERTSVAPVAVEAPTASAAPQNSAATDQTVEPRPTEPAASPSEALSEAAGASADAAAPPAAPAPPAASARPSTQMANLGAQFDLRPYSRPVLRGFGYGGFIQAQYQESELSEDQLQQGNIPFNRDQFGLRSARIRIEQGYDYTAYGFELDASTMRREVLSVRRAEATLLYRGENDVTIAPLVALTAGIIDLPFGFEVAESVRTRLFMERTVASSALFPTQNDVGVRLFGAWKFARYAFALVNGEPFGGSEWPTDPNAAKDIMGRLGGEGHVTKGIHLAGGASFAFGKGFHAGRPAVKDTLLWRDDNQDGIATATEIVGVPGTSASPSSNFERFALGADLEFQVETSIGASRVYGEVYVGSNHDRGLVVSNPVVTGVDVRQWGGYVAVSQDLTEYAVVALRAELYNPNADVFDQRRGEFLPASQRIITFSPAVGLILPRRARLLAQYDFVDDYLGRDLLGVPTDAKNNQWIVRLQVEL